MTRTLAAALALTLVACSSDGAATDDDSTPTTDASMPSPPDAAQPAPPDAAQPSPPDAAVAVPDAAPAPAGFARHVVAAAGTAGGPAYVSVADMTGDGKLDLVVSSLGVMAGFAIPKGEVTIYAQTASLDTWTKIPVVKPSDSVIFPNQTTIADVDGDGDLDMVVPSGFLICSITFIPGNAPCGALAWWEHTAAGYTRHDLVTGDTLFYHSAVLVDLDGDSIKDLLTVGEEQAFLGMGQTRAETRFLKGTTTAARFATTPTTIGPGLGSFPRALDLDGDADLDIASAEFFVAGESFAWYERTGNATTPTFAKHVINADSGPSIQLSFVPDLLGDGKLHAVGTNHVNTAKSPPDPQTSAVYLFDLPADAKTAWTKHQISEGIVSVPGSQMSPQAAPGIFGTGDIDADGDIDVLVSGDGDPNVYWLEQLANHSFTTHVLEPSLEQAGGMVVTNLDGDTHPDLIVTGYIDDVIYVYERE